MKKIVGLLFTSFVSFVASAQLHAGFQGSYTAYRETFQQATPGVGARLSYDLQSKYSFALTYNYGLPIKTSERLTLRSTSGNTTKDVRSQMRYVYQTITATSQYAFIGDEETNGKLYGILGGGLIAVTYKEAVTEDYNTAAYKPAGLTQGKRRGLSVNLGLGAQYRIGTPIVFADANLALVDKVISNRYAEDLIPTHLMFNVGVKFSLESLTEGM